MLATGLAIAMFLIAFVVHVLVWRLHKPENSGVALLLLFLVVLPIAVAGLTAGLAGPDLARASVLAQAGALYLAAMAAYINTYPAIEVDSVSFKIAVAAREAGAAGLPIDDLYGVVGKDIAVRPRLKNLLAENYATLQGDRFVLSGKGRALAGFYGLVRRIYGLGMGG